MKQRLLASAAMILIGSGIYAASTYYVPTPANETIAEQFPVAPLSLWTSGMNLPDARENLRNVEEESGQNGIPTPSPEVLNFVQYFPEDADESDPAQSYGGRIFQRLLKKDGAWINSIYSYASQTPQQLMEEAAAKVPAQEATGEDELSFEEGEEIDLSDLEGLDMEGADAEDLALEDVEGSEDPSAA